MELKNTSTLTIHLEYIPESENALFDICDFNGRVLKTGEINISGITETEVGEIPAGSYMIYILDGTLIERRRITI